MGEETREERLARARGEVDEQRRALALELLPGVPEAITDSVFRLAWDYGHSNGFGEVRNYYVDLADIVDDAYEAGQGVLRPIGGE